MIEIYNTIINVNSNFYISVSRGGRITFTSQDGGSLVFNDQGVTLKESRDLLIEFSSWIIGALRNNISNKVIIKLNDNIIMTLDHFSCIANIHLDEIDDFCKKMSKTLRMTSLLR